MPAGLVQALAHELPLFAPVALLSTYQDVPVPAADAPPAIPLMTSSAAARMVATAVNLPADIVLSFVNEWSPSRR
jgi:hypothetical protein